MQLHGNPVSKQKVTFRGQAGRNTNIPGTEQYFPPAAANRSPASPQLLALYFGASNGHRFAVDSKTGERVTPLTYPVLHGIPQLEAARESFPVTKASPDSLTKTVLQALEIGLWNSVDLSQQAATDIRNGQFEPAANKIKWIYGFNKVMNDISHAANTTAKAQPAQGKLSIQDSEAFKAFQNAFRDFSDVLRETPEVIDAGIHNPDQNPQVSELLHHVMAVENESSNWARRLANLRINARTNSVGEFIGSDHLQDAVFSLRLEGGGDNRFTQFRGLHQIPELLCAEANDQLEEAIRAVKSGNPESTMRHLAMVNKLVPGMLGSIRTMFENLKVADYHEIRAALELTSGSQSIAIRSQLFTKLYKELGMALMEQMTGLSAEQLQTLPKEELTECIETERLESWQDAIDQALNLRGGIQAWRDLHITFPKLYLGGQKTRSLIGAHAVKSADAMRTTGIQDDPLAPIARKLGLSTRDELLSGSGPLAGLELIRSIDNAIADRTQNSFSDVQNRKGKWERR